MPQCTSIFGAVLVVQWEGLAGAMLVVQWEGLAGAVLVVQWGELAGAVLVVQWEGPVCVEGDYMIEENECMTGGSAGGGSAAQSSTQGGPPTLTNVYGRSLSALDSLHNACPALPPTTTARIHGMLWSGFRRGLPPCAPHPGP